MPRQKSDHRDAAGLSNADEFRQIFFRFYRPVLAYFRNRGISDEESRDLTQETFLRIFRGLKEYRGDTIVATWVFEIASTVLRNQLRQQATRKRSGSVVDLDLEIPSSGKDLTDRPEVEDSPLEAVLEQERAQKLRQALNGLPDQMRRCVLLRVDQDLKYREIADLMRISIETVKAHLYQARQRLRDELGDYFTEEF